MTTEATPGALGSNDQLGAVSEAGRTTIADDDVCWLMTWGEQFPDKPPTEMMFEEGKALARLLAEEVIFLNSHWWEKDWPMRAQKITSLNVNCNDIFAWACADAEEIEYSEIQGLYDLWHADRTWGAAKWCAIKRRQQPQPPVIAAMKKAGAWDGCMEALGANTQDAEVQAMFAALRAPNLSMSGGRFSPSARSTGCAAGDEGLNFTIDAVQICLTSAIVCRTLIVMGSAVLPSKPEIHHDDQLQRQRVRQHRTGRRLACAPDPASLQRQLRRRAGMVCERLPLDRGRR